MTISRKTTLAQLAAIVAQALHKAGIRAVLTGGAVVSIYTQNAYPSSDLDFISPAEPKELEAVMKTLGFERKGRNFTHPKSDFSVEFPTGPLALGERMPVEPEGRRRIDGVTVVMLSPITNPSL